MRKMHPKKLMQTVSPTKGTPVAQTANDRRPKRPNSTGWQDCFVPIGVCSGQRIFGLITCAHITVFRIPPEHTRQLFGAWVALIDVMEQQENLETDFSYQADLMHVSLHAGGQEVPKKMCRRWVEMMCSAFLQTLDDLSDEDAA